jgi:hypothetical protein
MMLREQLTEEHVTTLRVIEKKTKEIWEKGEVNHTFFTLHGMKHSNAVIAILDRLVVGLNHEDQLNEIEKFCLLSAAYLHDVGMQHKYADDEKKIGSISISKNKPYTIQDKIRDEHHLRSGHYIIKNREILGLDKKEVVIVRLISEGHRKEDLYSNVYDDQVIGLTRIRVRLLSALLRLADELDIDYRRAPETLYEMLKIYMPDYSKIQWLKHHYVSGIIIEQTTKDGKRALSILINSQYPEEEKGKEISKILILSPIQEKIEELEKIFLRCGLEFDLKDKFTLDVNLEKIPDHLLKEIFENNTSPQSISQEKSTKLEIAYNILKKENNLDGVEKLEFKNIHKFLDCLNRYLDTDFPIIKDLYYNSCWKLGIAYKNYSEYNITYLLYPISYSKNDLQIKEISDELMVEFKNYVVTSIYSKNPIHIQPENYAKELVINKINEICDKKLLPLVHVSLFREVIFDFIDRFNECLGLEIKNSYTIQEIKYSFNTYLPIWVDEVLTNENVKLGIHPQFSPFIDPDFLLVQLNHEKRKEIDKRVNGRIKNNQLKTRELIWGSRKFPVKLIGNFLNSFSTSDFLMINRLYIPSDFSRPSESRFVWEFNSAEETFENIKTFFTEFPNVYNATIDACFPKLKNKINFFNNFDTLVVVVEAYDKYPDINTRPKIECYYLKSVDTKPKEEIKFYMRGREQIPINRETDFNSKILIDGKTYTAVSSSIGLLDYIFLELPMFNYLYKTLKMQMDDFFHDEQ